MSSFVPEKSRNLGIRATPQTQLALKQLALNRSTTVQGLIDEQIAKLLQSPQDNAAQGLPIVMDDRSQLDPDDAWIVDNLVEILNQRPQGAIFEVLQFTLRAAISEYGKSRTLKQRSNERTTGS